MDETQAMHGEIIRHDLDPAFLRSLSGAIAWGYRDTYTELSKEALTDDARNELFNKRRGEVAQLAMARVSKQHGVPFELRRLESNGQHKIIVKSGRVILIPEAVRSFDEHPKIADFKVELANAHSFIRQLELELGDIPNRSLDWSGCLLGVVLHGPFGPNFKEQHKDLGIFMLAVPDASYNQWVFRVDLQRTAMFGDNAAPEERPTNKQEGTAQQDRVIIRRKRKNRDQGTGT